MSVLRWLILTTAVIVGAFALAAWTTGWLFGAGIGAAIAATGVIVAEEIDRRQCRRAERDDYGEVWERGYYAELDALLDRHGEYRAHWDTRIWGAPE